MWYLALVNSNPHEFFFNLGAGTSVNVEEAGPLIQVNAVATAGMHLHHVWCVNDVQYSHSNEVHSIE